MRSVLILLFLFFGTVWADFISKYEYGESLYRDPRGISCAACHGEDGGGSQIVKNADRDLKRRFTAPNIKNISRDRLRFALMRGRSVMPVYRLTDAEIEALYIYLNTQK